MDLGKKEMTEYKENCAKDMVKNPEETSSSFSLLLFVLGINHKTAGMPGRIYHQPAESTPLTGDRLETREESTVDRKTQTVSHRNTSARPGRAHL